MPLRDHFHAPIDDLISWEAFHAQWPAMMVLSLGRTLPRRYMANPRVRAGLAEYEVRVYDVMRSRRLVAAVEFVSPANKDRPEHRSAFVTKCVALLQNRVSVTIVDLVTSRGSNLYGDMLDFLGQSDPALGEDAPPLYAVACRGVRPADSLQFESWLEVLRLGQPLPTLPLWLADNFSVPLWLADNFSVPLELEESYESTCKALRIP